MTVTGATGRAAQARVVVMFESLDKAKEWDAADEVKAARAIDGARRSVPTLSKACQRSDAKLYKP